MTPFVADGDFTLFVGDALEVLQELPDESVHCVVTSPPYWGLRDYGTGSWAGGQPDCDHVKRPPLEEYERYTDGGAYQYHRTLHFTDVCGKCGATRTDQQLGLEPTPDAYIERMVEVFREVRRVLRRDGTCWLNIGDSYVGAPVGSFNGGGFKDKSAATGGRDLRGVATSGTLDKTKATGLKPKDLVGIPWRLAFALQSDGWYLRSDIIWAKPNPMPESVTDRPTKSHEYVFLLTREARYFYDADAIREPHTAANIQQQNSAPKDRGDSRGFHAQGLHDFLNPMGRNARSVWTIATQPYAEAHFATFPEELPRRCIAAGTSEHGCCPVCGAPWERETSRCVEAREVDPSEIDRYGTGDAGVHRKVGGQYQKWLDKNPKTTIAWRSTCTCETWPHVPAPCVVLDPFAGSGTVALVARRLGRKSIGIELNPEYAELCARRLQQQSLFACVVDESAGMDEEPV